MWNKEEPLRKVNKWVLLLTILFIYLHIKNFQKLKPNFGHGHAFE